MWTKRGALPRLSTKRAREPTASGKDDDGAVPVLKRPDRASMHEALLKQPAKVDRPTQSERPTAHAGGNIYWSKANSA